MANDRTGLEEPLVTAAAPKPKIALKQWARLLGVWLITTVAAGIIPGAAVFVNMLAKAGTYGHLCEAAGEGPPPCFSQTTQLGTIMNCGQMIMCLALLPAGATFDSRGGRFMGIAGSVMVSIGMFLVSVTVFSALNGTDAFTSWLVIVGMLVADCGSLLTAYSFLGLLWHYPGCVTLILALQSAVYQISAVLPLGLEAFMTFTGLNLGFTFVAYAGLVALTVPLYAALIPTQKEYFDMAEAVCGVPLPKTKAGEFCTKLRQAWKSVRMDLKDHFFLSLGFATSIILCLFYSNMSSELGKSIFGTQAAGDRLARMQVEATSLIGALCAPVAANIVDRVGLSLFLKFLTIFICVPTVLFSIPQWWAATATTYCFAGFNVCYNLFINRYFMYYALPSRLGMYGGVFVMVMMLFMIPTNVVFYAMISMLPPEQRFLIPFRVIGVLSLVSLVVFNIRFRFAYRGKGVPEFPRMLPQEEEEICAPFGTKTVDETCKLLNMEKQALLKLLADPDPTKLKDLIMSMDWSQVAFNQEALAQRGDCEAVLPLPKKAAAAEQAEAAGDSTATATPSTARDDLTALASPVSLLDSSPAADPTCAVEEQEKRFAEQLGALAQQAAEEEQRWAAEERLAAETAQKAAIAAAAVKAAAAAAQTSPAAPSAPSPTTPEPAPQPQQPQQEASTVAAAAALPLQEASTAAAPLPQQPQQQLAQPPQPLQPPQPAQLQAQELESPVKEAVPQRASLGQRPSISMKEQAAAQQAQAQLPAMTTSSLAQKPLLRLASRASQQQPSLPPQPSAVAVATMAPELQQAGHRQQQGKLVQRQQLPQQQQQQQPQMATQQYGGIRVLGHHSPQQPQLRQLQQLQQQPQLAPRVVRQVQQQSPQQQQQYLMQQQASLLQQARLRSP